MNLRATLPEDAERRHAEDDDAGYYLRITYRKASDFKQFAVERKIFFHKDVDWHQVVDLGLVLLVKKMVDGGFDCVDTL